MLKMFLCEICSKSLSSKGNLKRHINEKHFRKQRVVKGIIQSPIHKNKQFENKQFKNEQFENKQFENKQFEKGNVMQGAFDIRLKENFKLFISGPSRCGKTVFVSKLIENIHAFAKLPPTHVIYVYKV